VLYVLCGIPGSGKSTWADAQFAASGAQIVSTDEIRARLFGDPDFDKNTNSRVFGIARRTLLSALAAKRDVCCDATNLKPGQRSWAIRIGRESGARVVGVSFACTVETALARQEGRERKVPPEVIARMAREFVPPSLAEGFDEVWEVKDGFASLLASAAT